MGSSWSSKKKDLSDTDIQFLKSRTNYDERTIREWYEGFKADCPSGQVSKEKFVDMYKMFFQSGNPKKFCEHVFRTFDTDGNGYIDFKEFLLAIAVTSTGTIEERLKWAFRMYDIDGGGTIEMPEMKKIVQALYDMVGPCVNEMSTESAEQRAMRIFEKMDANHDGHLTLDEFVAGCTEDPHLLKLLQVDVLKQT